MFDNMIENNNVEVSNMKINNIAQSSMIQNYNNNKRKIEKSKDLEKMDSLQISSEARKLSVQTNGIIREEMSSKIDSIKSQIKQGTYNPDPKLIAQKMAAVIMGSEV
jgi:negative regulator of flagellin synthesis FlgM